MRGVLIVIALCASALAQTYRIAGVLVDGRSGQPIERARITLAGGREAMAVTTKADGAFAFDVPLGKYSLTTEVHNWHQVYGVSGPSSGFGSAIITGPDQDTAHLIYRFFRPGSIYGKVTDDHDEGIENATVVAIRELVSGGKKITSVAWTAHTDDLGNYRMGPLPGGAYYVVATAVPWYAQQFRGVVQEPGDSTLNVAYPTTYFPGMTDGRQAGRLPVESGGEAQANFAIQAVPCVTVHPMCALENCTGSIRFYSVGAGGREVLVSTNHFMPGRPIYGIAPGHYTVRATGPGGSMGKAVDLAGGDATIDVAFPPPPKITGVVTYKNGVRPRANAFITMVNEDTNTSVGLSINAAGSFVYDNPPLARLRPVFGGVTGFFISQMSASGAQIRDGIFEVTEGSPVELSIEASDESGRVKGLVMIGDRPAPGIMVVIAPSGRAKATVPPRGFQTESDGSYDFTSLPAGEYLIFTTDQMDLEYVVEKVIEPYLATAKTVRVESHKVQTENLSFQAR